MYRGITIGTMGHGKFKFNLSELLYKDFMRWVNREKNDPVWNCKDIHGNQIFLYASKIDFVVVRDTPHILGEEGKRNG